MARKDSLQTKIDELNTKNQALIIENAKLRSENEMLSTKLRGMIAAHNKGNGDRRAKMEAAKQQALAFGTVVKV